MILCMYVWPSHIASIDQPGKVANPARGQLNRENNIPLSPCVPENLITRDGFSRPVPRQPAHLHTQAESVWGVSIYNKQYLVFFPSGWCFSTL